MDLLIGGKMTPVFPADSLLPPESGEMALPLPAAIGLALPEERSGLFVVVLLSGNVPRGFPVND